MQELRVNGWDGIRRFLREDIGVIFTSAGSMASTVLGAAFWLLLASLLEVTDYGRLNHAIAVGSVVAGIGSLGLHTTLTTFLAKGEEGVVDEVHSLTLLAGVLCALLLSIYDWEVGLLAAVLLVSSITQAEILGRRRYREFTLVMIGQRVAQILLALLLYAQLGVPGLLLGYALSFLVVSYRSLRALRRFSLRIPHLRGKRRFIVHSYGLTLIDSFATLDKVIVGSLFGFYALGLYQLGFQFFKFLAVIPTSLYKYLLPEEASGQNRHAVKLLALVLAVLAALGLFLGSPLIIERVFPKFVDAVPVVRLMSLAVIPATLVATFRANLLGRERSRTVFVSGVLYLGVLLAVLLVMGYALGVLGLGLTVVVANVVQAAYLNYASRLQRGIPRHVTDDRADTMVPL